MTRASSKVFSRALQQLSAAGGISLDDQDIRFRAQTVSLDTPLRAAEAAGAALTAGAAIADQIARQRGHTASTVATASRHAEASLTSFLFLRFTGASSPAPRIAPEDRTAAAGFFPSADDRYVYLHPGFPHNTRGILNLLGTADDKDAVAAAVAELRGDELEEALGSAGLCGAMVRTASEWDSSAAGAALNVRPVVEIIQMGDSEPEPFPDDLARPLTGIRVLDLTRILAGPTCARTLASYGASVLRVGAEHLPSIPLFVADTGFGKRSCHLDLRQRADTERLRELVTQTDVFSQGYRTGAMERLGFAVNDLVAARPGIVYVSINCYGHEGNWRSRPGWEQLAQTVTGMADIQGRHLDAETPTLLPAAVNDYTTGYLAAFGTLAALQRRAQHGGSYWVRVSLARTAVWTRALGLRRSVQAKRLGSSEIAGMTAEIDTAWGTSSYLKPAVSLSASPVEWRLPPAPLGTHKARW